MIRAIAVALLLLALPVSAGQNSIYPSSDPVVSLSTDPAPTCSADLSLGGYDVINNRTSLSSDAAPDASTLKPGQSAWSQATVNTTGAAAAVCGGVGRRFVTITAYTTSANDTLTVTVYSNATSAATVLTAGTSFACQALASNAECALALKTYLLATPIAGVTASCTDGTCSDAKVFLQPAPDVCDVVLAWSDAGGGGVAGTATSGANGPIKVGSGASLVGDVASCMQIKAADGLTNATVYGGSGIFSGLGVTAATGLSFATVSTCAYSASDTLKLDTTAGRIGMYLSNGAAYAMHRVAKLAWYSGNAGASAWDTLFDSTAAYNVTLRMADKGAGITIGMGTTQVLTCLGGGSATLVTSGLIPKGATLFGVSTRITSAGLTGPTSMDVGDVSDPDIYANDTGVADNDVSDGTDITANIANPQLAAGEVTLTFNGGNCTAGTIRVTAHLATITAPTVD